MLLDASEFPNAGWRELGEGSWRMGMSRRFGAISRRARRTGACSALRRYRQDKLEQGVFIQVGPYASADDAALMAAQAQVAAWHTWTGVERLEESQVDGMAVPDVEDALAWEHRNARGGYIGYQRFISGRVSNVVLVVAGSAREPGMAWDDLVLITASQASKLRRQLAAD